MVWYVVIGDDWCSIVPDSWVFASESMIWWPPKGINATTALSKKMQPSDTWTLTPYNQLIGPIDSYQEARQIEKKSVNISSDADTDTMRATFEEPLKRSQQVREVSSDDSVASNDSSFNKLPISKQRKDPQKKICPMPLPNCSYISKERCGGGTKALQSQLSSKRAFSPDCQQPVNSTSKQINDSKKTQQESTIEILGISSISPGKVKSMERHQERHDKHYLSDIQDLPGSQRFDVIENESSTRNHNNCCGECRDYTRKELKRLSRQMYAIEALLKEGNAGRSDEVVAQDLLPPLPLMTLKQFLQCENQLEVNTNMRKQFEYMICRIGGSTGKHFIRNTLSQIISNEVATQISWTGQKSDVSFKSTSISKLIIATKIQLQP
ncbi:PREDICTED: uncharacterized protein LOC108764159 isoform X2 [Trachymyrmex cornetzi]|uniref:uncharacterized protein LOC108764159 isoform X2 n=1 Tax=Trachymyrmex cornetzi TaxID=471704 RepID=UPI00084F1FE1|nr:PREDICTED: uncharacterized protein LOC108764159 isoform X2 [Trachymyrmex cornetzi]